MKSVCAWCEDKEKKKPLESEDISHGICDDCLEKMRAKIKVYRNAKKGDNNQGPRST